MLESLSNKQKIIFLLIMIFMIFFIIYYFYTTFYQEETISISNTSSLLSSELVEKENLQENDLEHQKQNNIIIYICGAVQENKVISLPEDSRIIDAIDAVGGLTENADLSSINLASILEDGEKIYIPQKGEQPENQIDQNSNSSITKEKININKANQAELETIPGIGPSTALKIIEYRNANGKFSSIEEIKNVSGIGEGKFGQMKEYSKIK